VAGCGALYFDARLVGRAVRDPQGWVVGRLDGWQPCPGQASRYVLVAGHSRHVCGEHARQITTLVAAGLADRLRWRWQQPA
jgi:hypothetical protein